MLDIQLLRTDLDRVAKRLADRPFVFDQAAFRALEEERKRLQARTQELQAKRNALAKGIGQSKANGGDVTALLSENVDFITAPLPAVMGNIQAGTFRALASTAGKPWPVMPSVPSSR